MLIHIRLQKGPPRLIDCEKYADGTDLRDAILALAPHSLMKQSSIGKVLSPGETLTAKSWTTQRDSIGCLGVFAVLALVVIGTAATGHLSGAKPSDAVSFTALGLVFFQLIISVILLACYRLDLNETEIRFKRPLFPCRQIALHEIESVEIRSNRGKHGPIDLMTIRAKHASISFSSSLERYDEIRDSILSRVPAGKVRYS